jgi:predicted nuclease of predicted toxin-antitoxin system
MRFLIDNALSPLLGEMLRTAGQTALNVRDVGLRAADDLTIFEHAGADDLVVVSADTDFGTLLAAREVAKRSVVLFRGEGSRAPADLFALIQANSEQLREPLEELAIAVFERSAIDAPGRLTTSRREPRYPIAQQFIGVGSSHPTRYAPLFTSHTKAN